MLEIQTFMNNIISNDAFNMYIMNSAEKTEKIIFDLETAVSNGLNPHDIKNEIYHQNNTNFNDLTDDDKHKIVVKVNELYQQYRYNRRRD